MSQAFWSHMALTLVAAFSPLLCLDVAIALHRILITHFAFPLSATFNSHYFSLGADLLLNIAPHGYCPPYVFLPDLLVPYVHCALVCVPLAIVALGHCFPLNTAPLLATWSLEISLSLAIATFRAGENGIHAIIY